MINRFIKCDKCGKTVSSGHLVSHQRGSGCLVRPPDYHCDFCLKPLVRMFFARLQLGDHIEAVAKDLHMSTRNALRTRSRGRQNGCLPPITPEEYAAELRDLALERLGEKDCSECGTPFVPRINTPGQSTCGKKCRRKRLVRMRKEGLIQAKSSAPPIQDAAKLEAQVAPLKRALEETMRSAYAVKIITGEASHKLWCECLGIEYVPMEVAA